MSITGDQQIGVITQYFALSRPLLAEPQLIKRWKEGSRAEVDYESLLEMSHQTRQLLCGV